MSCSWLRKSQPRVRFWFLLGAAVVIAGCVSDVPLRLIQDFESPPNETAVVADVVDVPVETPCMPECDGKECGDDGCRGTCGECAVLVGSSPLPTAVRLETGASTARVAGPASARPFSRSRSAGRCGCVPNCTGKECGADGCGGSCGTCDDNQWCTKNDCANGICDYSKLESNTCWIGESCWNQAQPNPDNACQKCDPAEPSVWSNVAEGLRLTTSDCL